MKSARKITAVGKQQQKRKTSEKAAIQSDKELVALEANFRQQVKSFLKVLLKNCYGFPVSTARGRLQYKFGLERGGRSKTKKIQI